ncbi:excalibur calcium-binding domain-containing protein [Phytohabitans kaempferiae]|uniref:Excalibur calcium-binding domain-containing protein n=1 Tax=Phytohabitans kaempferiae TaxID=1620943 RepID=A0ABV6M188_9ACTN
MSYPPLDEPSQQRRASVYGRANQATAHYRPLRKGRPRNDPSAAAQTNQTAKTANRRRFVLFAVALLVAIAFGTALFGVVFAAPAPMANPPRQPVAPEPAVQPLPPTGRGSPAEQAPPPPPPPPTKGRAATTGGDPSPRKSPTPGPVPGEGGDADPTTTPPAGGTFTYQNCNKAWRASAAPLYPGDPGYSAKLDKDGNGIACDEKPEK